VRSRHWRANSGTTGRGWTSPELPGSFRRNRRQHGGAAQRLNDDRLERLTEEEREVAGLDPDPDDRHDEEDEADAAG